VLDVTADGPFGLAADFNHIGDLNEMVLHPLPAVETGGAGGFDEGLAEGSGLKMNHPICPLL